MKRKLDEPFAGVPEAGDNEDWTQMTCVDCGNVDGWMGRPHDMTHDEVRAHWAPWRCTPCFGKWMPKDDETQPREVAPLPDASNNTSSSNTR